MKLFEFSLETSNAFSLDILITKSLGFSFLSGISFMLAGTTLSGLMPIVLSKLNLCGEDEASMSFDVFT